MLIGFFTLYNTYMDYKCLIKPYVFSSLDFEYKGKAIFFNRQIFSQLFSLFYEKNYFSNLLCYIMFIYGRNGVYSPGAVADTTPSIALPFDCTAKVMVFFQTTKHFMDYFMYRHKKNEAEKTPPH